MRQLSAFHPFDDVKVLADLRIQGRQIVVEYRLEDGKKLVEDTLHAGSWTKWAKADELWKTTCFELFLGHPKESNYWEFNFSPANEKWNLYSFDDYRVPQPPTPCDDFELSMIQATGDVLKCELNAKIPLTHVEAGLTAVMLPRFAFAQDKKVKVAAVFATPIEEPWDHQIHVALQKAEKELGIEYKWSEKVQTADFGRVMREYAQGGYDLVMGDAFAAERESRRTAKQFPKTAFLFGSGAGPAEPNFGVFDNWIHEPAYLSGMIAGKMSKSGVVGAVAAMGIPEVNRLVNAFFAGAKEADKDVKKKVTFIGSFFDPPKAKEAAIAQIDAGVDVIYAERFGVIEAAAEKKVYAISNMSDQSSLAPDTVITGPVWDMYPTVEQAVKLVKAGVYTAQDYGDFSRMAKGGSSLAPYHKFDDILPADVKEMVEKKKAEILEGNFRVDVDENTPVSD